MQSVTRNDLLRAADACERAARAGNIQQERCALMDILADEHAIKVGLMAAKMRGDQSCGALTGRHQERVPIRVDGDDWARVESRIPADIFWHLYQQKNFGWDGLKSDEGQRDILKANPAFGVKTVTGKTTVGWRRGHRPVETTGPTRRVTFGRGTMEFAK